MAKARLNRDDKGTTAFVKDFMRTVLGLSPETTGLIVQRIKKHGEWAPMKSNLRALSGVIYKRFNTAIDMAEEQLEDGGEEEGEVEQPVDFDKKQNDREDDVETKDDEQPVDFDKEENKREDDVKEGYTFMKYLLTEIQLDVDLDDPTTALGTIKKASRMGTDRTRKLQDQKRKQEIRDIDSTSPTAALDKRIAVMKQQLSQMEKKRERVAGNE